VSLELSTVVIVTMRYKDGGTVKGDPVKACMQKALELGINFCEPLCLQAWETENGSESRHSRDLL
jgi:hypothetical protein